MSMVIKEYACPTHGIFESTLPVCVTCGFNPCNRVFTQAPAFKSSSTKMKDGELRQLTLAYGLSDFSNNENTRHEQTNLSPTEAKLLSESGMTVKHPDTWESLTPDTASLLSGAGISVRKPSDEERKKPTVLRAAPINKALKGKIGAYEAIRHKEDKVVPV
jgi:hypothetical protein